MTAQHRHMRADGVAARLLAYLEANQDEELTVPDAAVKFDVAEGTIYTALQQLQAHDKPVEFVRVIRHKSKGVMK